MYSYFRTTLLYILIYNVSKICADTGSLEQMNDEDMLNLIRTENYVITLFTKQNCPDCEKLEDVLYQIREDLVDSLNAWVVKCENSQLVRIYSPSLEPALVFFRHGVPLLYHGEMNDELILSFLVDNKDPCVRELNDDNFEHLTQVSTGATTGDWFILFYTTDCINCQNLQASWEAVCAKLKMRLNVARINKQAAGKVTGRRFDVATVPSFLFFRHGKMYRYNSPKFDISSLSSFPVEEYQKARVEPVSPPKAFMEDLLLGIMEFLRECSFLLKIAITAIGVLALLSVAIRLTTKKERRKISQKKSKSK